MHGSHGITHRFIGTCMRSDYEREAVESRLNSVPSRSPGILLDTTLSHQYT